MAKRLLLIGVIITVLMLISTPALADKKVDDKGKADNKAEAFSNIANEPDGVGIEKVYNPNLPTMAWGRYGPFNLNSGASAYKTVYYGGSMGGTPIVVCSLEMPIPWNQKAFVNADSGYIKYNKFDARVTSVSGSLSGAYIDYIAIR